MVIVAQYKIHSNLIDMPSSSNADHDGRYYTETEIQNLFVPYENANKTVKLNSQELTQFSLGSELLTNPSFTGGTSVPWVVNVDWVYSTLGEYVEITGAAGQEGFVEQNIAGLLTIGKTYRVAYTVAVDGDIDFTYETAPTIGGVVGSTSTDIDGIITEDITATEQNILRLYGKIKTGTGALRITDASVKEVSETLISLTNINILAQGVIIKGGVNAAGNIIPFIPSYYDAGSVTNPFSLVYTDGVNSPLSNLCLVSVSGTIEMEPGGQEVNIVDSILTITGPDGVGSGVAAPNVENVIGGDGGSGAIGGQGAGIIRRTGNGGSGPTAGPGGDWEDYTGDAASGAIGTGARGGDRYCYLGAGGTGSVSSGRPGDYYLVGRLGTSASGPALASRGTNLYFYGGDGGAAPVPAPASIAGDGGIIYFSAGVKGLAGGPGTDGEDGYVALGDVGTNEVRISPLGKITFAGSSGMPFAEIKVESNLTQTVIASAGTPVQVTVFDTDGCSNNVTPDHTNDHITIDIAGCYLILISATVNSVAGAGSRFELMCKKNNGASDIIAHMDRNLAGGGSNAGIASLSGIALNLSVNDTVEVWIENETNTQNYVVEDISLVVQQIGGIL